MSITSPLILQLPQTCANKRRSHLHKKKRRFAALALFVSPYWAAMATGPNIRSCGLAVSRTRRGHAALRHRLDALERQDPHSLAPVNRALVRFGLNHELITLDGVKADLISSKSASVPFDIDMMDNLPGR